MRVIGMDVHRAFARIAILDDGKVISEQRLDLVQDKVVAFGRTLRPDDEVVLEATGNTAAIERLLRPFVGRVVIANPRMVRAIAYARVKTDKIDAITLARLQASGFLPEVWAADEDTVQRRRQATERMGLLDETVRLKSRIRSPSVPGHETEKSRVEGRRSSRIRKGGSRQRLLDQGNSTSRNGLRQTRRRCLCGFR